LQYFSDIWKNKKELIESQSDHLLQELKKQQEFIREGMMKDSSEAFPDFLACRDKILQKVDTVNGGFGNAPKFPQFGSISFLYTYSFFSNDSLSLHHAKFAADALISGGIFDHVGGGMARYSTDDAWLVPHFEKMLYDNALLIEVLSDLYSITQENRYKRAIHKTIEFCKRELLSPEGLFYAALDADSEGEEGKYYVFSKKEIVEVLVLGHPTRLNGQANEMTPLVLALKEKLELEFPEQKVVLIDERYTSKMAMQTLIAMGSKKKDRKEKAGNLDKVSAAIILQSYLERQ
jgi:putative transcription antitermination factor YqgF